MKKKIFTLLTLLSFGLGVNAQTVYNLTTWTGTVSDYTFTDGSGNAITSGTDYSTSGTNPLSIFAKKITGVSHVVCINKTSMPNVSFSYTKNGSDSDKKFLDIKPGNYVRQQANDVILNIKGLAANDIVVLTIRAKGGNLKFKASGSSNYTAIYNSDYTDKNNYSSWIFKANEAGTMTINQSGGFDITTIEINPADVTLTAPTKEYTTYCSTKPLDFSSVDGLEAYVISSIADSKATLKKVDYVAAMQGVILKKTGSAASYDIPVLTNGTNIATAEAETNKLVGITTNLALTADAAYILHDGVFVPATAGTLSGGKAYIKAEDVSAPVLSFDFGDETTAIKAVETKNIENNVYRNLAGQQVAQPTKGLYIVNGKKVVIK